MAWINTRWFAVGSVVCFVACSDTPAYAPGTAPQNGVSATGPVVAGAAPATAAQPGTAAAGAMSNGAVAPAAMQPRVPAQAGSAAAAPAAAGSDAAGAVQPPSAEAANPYAGFESEAYADDAAWMCKPGIANDYCLRADLDATEFMPDGSSKPYDEQVGSSHPFDCVYWYPTVSRPEPQMSRDFTNPSVMMRSALTSQAARFARVCNVYAPFYRVVSLEDTMAMRGDMELAYADVVESFKQYVANFSEGRPFVLMGHSQGSNHLLRMLREEVDPRPELRERMLSALLIGFPAQPSAFKNLVACETPQQTGCIINFMSYSASAPPSPPMSASPFGASEMCSNPAALGGGSAVLKGAFFAMQGAPSGPFRLYRNMFKAECMRPAQGPTYLQISPIAEPGDQRMSPVNLDSDVAFLGTSLGLHLYDFNFPIDDLIELVHAQAEAKAAKAMQP